MIQTEPWVAPASELRKSHSENGAELWGGLCCHRTGRCQNGCHIPSSGLLVPPIGIDHKHGEAGGY